ncbi:hypothetical protein CK203_066639 [Vitis vinifera]|uniref:Uncharacterized protein n=1 Tax=Vitis vinifera TaxID=29760 RepID=A0A438EVI9_VITVI|nr:hypothetical protein CK203_066639 [Vitis vinifera]
MVGVKGVSYDGRPLIVNGKRELLFSGSIHYPRSIPEDHMKRFTRMIIDMMSKEK